MRGGVGDERTHFFLLFFEAAAAAVSLCFLLGKSARTKPKKKRKRARTEKS